MITYMNMNINMLLQQGVDLPVEVFEKEENPESKNSENVLPEQLDKTSFEYLLENGLEQGD